MARGMTNAAQREYAEALDAYNAALARLREAKRHFDPKRAPEAIAQRRAMSAVYRAKRKAKRERDKEWWRENCAPPRPPPGILSADDRQA